MAAEARAALILVKILIKTSVVMEGVQKGQETEAAVEAMTKRRRRRRRKRLLAKKILGRAGTPSDRRNIGE